MALEHLLALRSTNGLFLVLIPRADVFLRHSGILNEESTLVSLPWTRLDAKTVAPRMTL